MFSTLMRKGLLRLPNIEEEDDGSQQSPQSSSCMPTTASTTTGGGIRMSVDTAGPDPRRQALPAIERHARAVAISPPEAIVAELFGRGPPAR